MHFSISFGLSFMCVTLLLFLPAQGQRQYATSEPMNGVAISPPCCAKVSKARIWETVKDCFEQGENTFPHCSVRAYIFWTVSNKQFCVDPSAKWLPGRLRKLQARGIFCKYM